MKTIKIGFWLFLIAQLAVMIVYLLEGLKIGETAEDSFYFFLLGFEFSIFQMLLMIKLCYSLNYEKEKEELPIKKYIKFLYAETSFKKKLFISSMLIVAILVPILLYEIRDIPFSKLIYLSVIEATCLLSILVMGIEQKNLKWVENKEKPKQ